METRREPGFDRRNGRWWCQLCKLHLGIDVNGGAVTIMGPGQEQAGPYGKCRRPICNHDAIGQCFDRLAIQNCRLVARGKAFAMQMAIHFARPNICQSAAFGKGPRKALCR